MLKTVPSAPSFNQLKELHSAWIEIDLDQFELNLRTLQKYLGDVRLCLPVKANAYGHGLIPMAQAAQKVGVDYLGVSNPFEGVRLREAGIEIPILVFGAFQKEHLKTFVEYQLEFTVSSRYKAQLAQDVLTELKSQAKVHLEVDTGMNRTGARPESAKAIYDFIQESSALQLVGIYSHFANSDDKGGELAALQEKRFLRFIEGCDGAFIAHLANSGAVIQIPRSHYQMVRPGLLSYGLYPKALQAPFDPLKSCFTLKSRVSYFKVVHKNEGIGYGPTHKTQEQTRIATISIGYGDGYRRLLSNQGEVLIRGKRFPIVGSICMDQMMVDLQDQEAYVGDEVVLIGKQGNEEITVEEVAKKLQTITYEVLCGFTARVPRLYI